MNGYKSPIQAAFEGELNYHLIAFCDCFLIMELNLNDRRVTNRKRRKQLCLVCRILVREFLPLEKRII